LENNSVNLGLTLRTETAQGSPLTRSSLSLFVPWFDFHSHDTAGEHLEQVSADLKIRLVFSTPGVPRGRGRVERFFSTIDQMFLCTLPGFKSSGGKRRLTLAEFDVLLREFILDIYHERLHGETGVALCLG
jgi:transposase InsO family protein